MRFLRNAVLGLALLLGGASSVLGQSSPGLITGQVPTAGQWNGYFIAKQDVLGYQPLPLSGGVMTGRITTSTPTTAGSGFRLPPGVAPSAPVNGDVWTTSAGIFVRIAGTTVGPLTASGGGSFSSTAPISVTFPSSIVTYALDYNSTLTVSGGSLSLPNVVTAGGPTGSATVAPVITYDAQGRLTTVTTATITPAIGSITGLGTGVATALGVNVGSAGAFVVNGGALGTPSSGTLTNATGLPIASGVSGLGTGVATALGIAIGSAGAPVVLNGALGTPSSGTATNLTGLPISTGLTGAGTGVLTALGINVGSAGAFVTFNGAGGTPSSITLTNGTGLPTTGLTGTLQAAQEPAHTGDVTNSAGSLALAIGATKVTSAMLNADVFSTAHTWAGQQTFVAPILGTPASATLTNATGLPTTGLTGTLQAAQEPAHTGDVTNSAGSLALAIGATKVTSAMLNADVFSTAHSWGGIQTFTTPVFTGLPTGTGVATANTVSTLVARDGSGNFAAGTITATLTGTASNASQLLGGTWAIPGTIGSTTPNTGAFTTLTASTSATSPTVIAGTAANGITIDASNILRTASAGSMIIAAGTGAGTQIVIQVAGTTGFSVGGSPATTGSVFPVYISDATAGTALGTAAFRTDGGIAVTKNSIYGGRQTMSAYVPVYDLGFGALAVNMLFSPTIPIVVPAASNYNSIGFRTATGGNNTYTIGAGSFATEIYSSVEATSGSAANSSAYGAVLHCSNNGPGVCRGIHAGGFANAGATGTIVGMVAQMAGVVGIDAANSGAYGATNTGVDDVVSGYSMGSSVRWTYGWGASSPNNYLISAYIAYMGSSSAANARAFTVYDNSGTELAYWSKIGELVTPRIYTGTVANGIAIDSNTITRTAAAGNLSITAGTGAATQIVLTATSTTLLTMTSSLALFAIPTKITSTIYTTGGASFAFTSNMTASPGLSLGGPAKATAYNSANGTITLVSDDASAPFQGFIGLGTNATAGNRRLVIEAIEQTVAYRNITLAENGGVVGIGTATPVNPLHVVYSNATVYTGGGYTNVAAFRNSDTTNGNVAGFSFQTLDGASTSTVGVTLLGVMTSHTTAAVSADLAIQTRNAGVLSEKMRIMADGSVGIGLTTSVYPLTVRGTTGTGIAIQNSGSSNKEWRMMVSGTEFDIAESGVGIPFSIAAGTGIVSINGNGASSPLDINATLSNPTGYLAAKIHNTGGLVYLGVDSSAGGQIATGSLAYATVIATGTNTSVQLATNQVVAMTVLPSRNVGIGTAAPNALLQIGSSTNTYAGAGLLLGVAGIANGYISATDGLYIKPFASSGSGNGSMYIQNGSEVTKFTFDTSTGGLTISDFASIGTKIRAAGTAPALSACGTGSPAISGSDLAGEVTMGTAATGCIITFNAAYTSTPYCTVTWHALLAIQSYTVSNTAITITQTATSGDTVNYVCVARAAGWLMQRDLNPANDNIPVGINLAA